MSDGSHSNSRRNFLKSSLIAISTAALPNKTPAAVTAVPSSAKPDATPRFLSEPERHFLESGCRSSYSTLRTLARNPGRGVINYIDLQMAGD